MKHAAHGPYDLAKATIAPVAGGYDLTKAAQTPQFGKANLSLTTGGKQSPVTSSDHPLAGHSPSKARYSPRSAKGRAKVAAAFHEVEEDEPEVVGTTRRKKGAAAAGRQKTGSGRAKA